MTNCPGSKSRVMTSPGERFTTAGYVRENEARNIACPECGRRFAKARIAHTDHGMPTQPMAVVPAHRR